TGENRDFTGTDSLMGDTIVLPKENTIDTSIHYRMGESTLEGIEKRHQHKDSTKSHTSIKGEMLK
ncbi:MAG TPA: hypothetical protein VFF27_13525, partial [Bacteroidia bacterium]|nr:hypothetical protein [Bacteroidia bacterium]